MVVLIIYSMNQIVLLLIPLVKASMLDIFFTFRRIYEGFYVYPKFGCLGDD